jgi:hypothetical protein
VGERLGSRAGRAFQLVELAHQLQQAPGGGREVGGELGDLVLQLVHPALPGEAFGVQ